MYTNFMILDYVELREQTYRCVGELSFTQGYFRVSWPRGKWFRTPIKLLYYIG